MEKKYHINEILEAVDDILSFNKNDPTPIGSITIASSFTVKVKTFRLS